MDLNAAACRYTKEQILSLPVLLDGELVMTLPDGISVRVPFPRQVYWRNFDRSDYLCVWDGQGIAWEPVETYDGPKRRKYFG